MIGLGWRTSSHGLPWMCCTAAQKKEVTLLRFFKRTLGATDSLRHSFSSCYCTRLLQRSGRPMMRISGALEAPSILNVFAAEELVESSILHIPSPTPTNAWETTVLVLRC